MWRGKRYLARKLLPNFTDDPLSFQDLQRRGLNVTRVLGSKCPKNSWSRLYSNILQNAQREYLRIVYE